MRGQTSIEFLLVVVIVLSVAVYIMDYYHDTMLDSVAMSVVRSDIDNGINRLNYIISANVAKIRLINNTFYVYLNCLDTSGKPCSNDCYTTQGGCYSFFNTSKIESDIMVALGCSAGDKSCKGKSYKVNMTHI